MIAARRSRVRSIVSFGVLAVLVAAAGTVAAQSPESPPLGAARNSEAEDEVYALYGEGRLLTARRKTDALLEENPDSIVGHFVMGAIEREAEGSLPRAMAHVGRARELYEQTWPTPNDADAPWRLHREILFSAQQIAGEMEKHEYRLQLLDYHDSLYDPNLTGEHAWPLMHLGRFDEAREAAKKSARSVDVHQRSLGLNALCAIEGQARTREDRFEACIAAFESARARAEHDSPFARPDEVTSVTVHAYNAALAADAVLRPDEVERLALEGTHRLEFTAANPWRVLVRLYARQGRVDEALAALREMQSFRRQQPPHLRDQVRADADATFAEVLLIAGETELGMRVMDRALERPDRRGLTVSSPEQVMGAHALLRRAMRRTHEELAAERRSYAGVEAPLEQLSSLGSSRVAELADEERILAVAADDDRLQATFALFVHGGLEPMPSWLVGDLIDVLGPGVVAVVLDRVRESQDFTGLEPYYDALEAELALAQGDDRRSATLAATALDSLPDTEALMRARVAAVAAEAHDNLGEHQAAIGFLAEVMQRDAGTMRRRAMVLPVRIEDEASGESHRTLAGLLRASPRLDVSAEGAFAVRIRGEADTLDLCLYAPDGAELACVEPRWPAKDDAESPHADTRPVEPSGRSPHDYARFAAEAFHRRAFAMPVGLSNVDLGSLDGSATMSAENTRERARALIESLGEDG